MPFSRIIRPMFGDKSKSLSEEHRESGNAAFHAGNLRQALVLYSLAVFHAPQDQREDDSFALALANRYD